MSTQVSRSGTDVPTRRETTRRISVVLDDFELKWRRITLTDGHLNGLITYYLPSRKSDGSFPGWLNITVQRVRTTVVFWDLKSVRNLYHRRDPLERNFFSMVSYLNSVKIPWYLNLLSQMETGEIFLNRSYLSKEPDPNKTLYETLGPFPRPKFWEPCFRGSFTNPISTVYNLRHPRSPDD